MIHSIVLCFLVTSSPTLNDELSDGESRLKAGQCEEALGIFQSYSARNADSVQAHLGIARAWVGLRCFAQALDAFTRAQELAPDNISTMAEIAVCLQRQALHEEALGFWRKLVSRESPVGWPPSWQLSFANASSEVGASEEAIRTYGAFLKTHPENTSARMRLGLEWLKLDRFDLAASEFSVLVERAPEVARHHYLLGWVKLKLGENTFAEASLMRAREKDPGDTEVHLALGRLYEREGRRDDAIECYLETTKRNPLADSAWRSLGLLARRNGEVDRALEFDSKFKHVSQRLEICEERLRDCERRLGINPHDVDACMEGVQVFLEESRLQFAETWLLRLLSIDPHHEVGILNLSGVLAHRGAFEDALLESKKILRKVPTHGLANLQAGKICAAQSHWADAILHLERGLHSLGKESREAHQILSIAYRKIGNTAKAAEHLKLAEG